MSTKNYTPLLESVQKVNALNEIRSQQRFLLALEGKLQREIEKIFKIQGDLVGSHLRDDHIDEGTLNTALDMAFLHTRKQFLDLLIKYKITASYFGIRSQAKQLGFQIPTPKMREAAASVGISFDAVDHEAYQYIAKDSASRVSGIDDTTRNRIREILDKGTADKLSYSAIAQNIRDEFSAFATPAPQQHIRDRAELVAVTEIRDAHEYSQSLVRQKLKNQGWIIEKAWGISDDEQTCDICKANADAGWISDNDVFPSGDLYPSAHPGCRCYTMTRNVGLKQSDEEEISDEEPTVYLVAPSAYVVSSPIEMSRSTNPMVAIMGVGAFVDWLIPKVEKPAVAAVAVQDIPDHWPYIIPVLPIVTPKKKVVKNVRGH